MKSGIYKIVNTNNGKCYVGSSFVIQRRWNRHKRELIAGIHPNAKLQASWNKHGADAFDLVVIELVGEDALIGREQFWIDSIAPDYNISLVAGNTAGVFPDAEAREKMAAAKRGKPRSPETRAKISAYQKTRVISEETIRKASEARRGQKRTQEARLRMSLAAKGRVMSEDQKARISAALKATWAEKRSNACRVS